MAIYHLSVKTVSRSTGRSATAAAAYRAGVKITDERTGQVHDYTRKRDVIATEIVLPTNAPAWAHDRKTLWNAAEKSETRRNSTVAREFEVALPSDLTPEEQQKLAREFAGALVERHGCAADVAIHAPNREGDERNIHAHILLTTRRLGPDGFTEKTRELDDKKTGPELVTEWREGWANLVNKSLERAGVETRIDHRSLEAQGDVRLPGIHLGPHVHAMEMRGIQTDVGNIYRARQVDNGRIVSLEEHRQKLEQERRELQEALNISRLKAQRSKVQGSKVSISIPNPVQAAVAEAFDGVQIVGSEIHADPTRHTAFGVQPEQAEIIERLKACGLQPAVVALDRNSITVFFRHRPASEIEHNRLGEIVDRTVGGHLERVQPRIYQNAMIVEATGREIDLDRIIQRDRGSWDRG